MGTWERGNVGRGSAGARERVHGCGYTGVGIGPTGPPAITCDACERVWDGYPGMLLPAAPLPPPR